MKKTILISLLVGTMGLFSTSTFSQCENWMKSSEIKSLEDAYSIYRSALRSGDYEIAYLNWEKVYQSAPGADGRRSTVYSDGRILLEAKFLADTDIVRKKENKDFIFRLIEEQKLCFPGSKIVNPSKDVMDFR
jgi:hypothetical protein